MSRAESQADFYLAHPGYSTEYSRLWSAAHPGYFAARTARRTAPRKLMLSIIKQELGCIDCGYNANPVALDFDHVNGDKLFGLSASVAREINSIQAELEKCVVRCANCHRIRTRERRETS